MFYKFGHRYLNMTLIVYFNTSESLQRKRKIFKYIFSTVTCSSLQRCSNESQERRKNYVARSVGHWRKLSATPISSNLWDAKLREVLDVFLVLDFTPSPIAVILNGILNDPRTLSPNIVQWPSINDVTRNEVSKWRLRFSGLLIFWKPLFHHVIMGYSLIHMNLKIDLITISADKLHMSGIC